MNPAWVRKHFGPCMEYYGLTEAQVSEVRSRLLIRQGWKCQLCKRPIGNREGERKPNLDHSRHHKWIRGVVCWQCNKMLGNYSASELRAAAAYVEDEDRMGMVQAVVDEVKAELSNAAI